MTVKTAQTHKYLESLKVEETYSDHVLKTANARDLIACLPSSDNVKRNLDLVPNIAIAFRLSTSPTLPIRIRSLVDKSNSKEIFGDDHLMGLCTSGIGLPVKIFLHHHFMMASDPSGALLEEVTWHEYVHGIEGVEENASSIFRKKPWSFGLQEEMLQHDKTTHHEPQLPESLMVRQYMEYLRKGTALQDNVSEVFARAAVLYMLNIREHGLAPDTEDFLVSMLRKDIDIGQDSRTESNFNDLVSALSTFSDRAQIAFWNNSAEMMRRVATLYGYEPSNT